MYTLERGNEVKEIKPCVKYLQFNCTLKLPKRRQDYVIHQWQIQIYEHNITKEIHEILFQNLFLIFPFSEQQKSSIYRHLFYKTWI